MRSVRLAGEDWSGVWAQIASSPMDNWRGIRGAATGFGLILRRRAIHTIGLPRPLRGVGVDSSGTVLIVRVMRPNRFFYFPSTAYVLEFPMEIPPPGAGTRIVVVE